MKKKLILSILLTISLITTSQISAPSVNAKTIRSADDYESTHPTWFGDVPTKKEDGWSDEKYLTWLENAYVTYGVNTTFNVGFLKDYRVRDSAIPGLKLKIALHDYAPEAESTMKSFAEWNKLDFNALNSLNESELKNITDSVGLDFNFVMKYKTRFFPDLCYGWAKNSLNKWYYSENKNTWLTNTWKEIDGLWYYFDNSSRAVTGWNHINGRWYYFYDNCSMAHDCMINSYRISSSGAVIPYDITVQTQYIK